MRSLAFAVVAGVLLAGSAPAATLVHDYEFGTDSSVGFQDSAGSIDGTLYNGATVSAGRLVLDGSDDFAQFDDVVFPSGGSIFSVYVAFADHRSQGSYAELISQDGGSFYLGSAPDQTVRVSDSNVSTGVAMPVDGGAHDFLLTNDGSQSKLYVDGVLQFTGNPVASSPYAGAIARIGKQYSCCGEYFQGSIDAVRIYDGIASYAEASIVPSAAPEPASWAMMAGGFGLLGSMLRRARRTRAAA